jgi:hypothetical protein
MEDTIERLSREAAEELDLNEKDRLYVKNLLLRFSIKVFEGIIEKERADTERIKNR